MVNILRPTYDICAAAVDDGFPHFQQLIDAPNWLEEGAAKGWNVASPGGLCCTWGLQRIYRSIAEGDQTVLAMVDDYVLPYRWHELNNMLSYIPALSIFQLGHFSVRDFGLIVDDECDYHYMDWYPSPLADDPRISKGLAGVGDDGLILTSQGAQCLLDQAAKHPFWTMEFVVYKYALENPDRCYALNYYTPGFQKRVRHFTLRLQRVNGESDSDIEL